MGAMTMPRESALPLRAGGARGSRGTEPLARNEPLELFSRWQEHGERATRDELVERYMPLARKLARRYAGRREPFNDLLQVASYGLLNAIDRFDSTRGTAFSSYAVPTILGELKRYLRDLGWSVHVPRGAQELALKVELAREALTTSLGRSPTLFELAEHLETNIEVVLEGLEAAAAHHSTSLDAPLDARLDDPEGESVTLGETLGVEEGGFGRVEEGLTVAAALRQLSDHEQKVLALRFFEGMTQSEIAKETGFSQMHVSRTLRRTIERLNELTQSPLSDAPPSGA
jgi:RNA polymerase sigma-B factor